MPWRLLLLVLAYVWVAPAGFLLGPLVGLLLISRPASGREWAWLFGAGAATLLWLRPSGDLVDQFVRAAGVLFSGAFLALTLWRPRPSLRQGSLALGAALAALAVWCQVFSIDFAQVEFIVTNDMATAFTAQAKLASEWPEGRETARMFDQMAASAGELARYFPAALMLAALAGASLAWRFHYRIATHRFGSAPSRFAAFTFSDHAVWAVVIALGLLVLPARRDVTIASANLLMVLVALYALRGAAIGRWFLAGVPGVVAVTLTVISFLLFPFVAAGLTLVGLADTWLDFRRRLAPPAPRGDFDR